MISRHLSTKLLDMAAQFPVMTLTGPRQSGKTTLHDQNLNPRDVLSLYVSTYVERDIRSLSNLRNLDQFERFVGICAANIGQLVNYSRFANDVGVDQETIKAWISLLKASYIVFTLRTHAKNYRKRVTKSQAEYQR